MQTHPNGKTAPTITHSSQIKDLPWGGNFYADSHLFDAVHQYAEAEDTPREEARAAFEALSLYGMGMDDPISDEELDQAIAEGRAARAEENE